MGAAAAGLHEGVSMTFTRFEIRKEIGDRSWVRLGNEQESLGGSLALLRLGETWGELFVFGLGKNKTTF